MKKTLSIFYNGLKINIICQNEKLFKEQYKMYENFFVKEKTPYFSEITIFYTKSQKIIDRLSNEIECDKNHFSINPFGHMIYNVQNKQNYVRFITKNKNSVSIKHNNGSYIIVGSETENTKYAPYILILELISRYNETNGCSIFHSTGFTLNDKGILIVGESGSGKTTFLAKIIDAKQDISFLSNDRVYVGNGKMYYFPLEIILSMGTVKHANNLLEFFVSHKITENWLNKELNMTSDIEKCGIKPKTFCEVNNIGYVSSSDLSIIVFPEIDHDNRNNLQIKKLQSAEIKEKLEASCYTPNDKETHRDMWIEKGVLSKDQLKNLAQKNILNMTKKQICISCKFGYDVTGEQILFAINNEIIKNNENDNEIIKNNENDNEIIKE